MNAGAHGACIADVVDAVYCLRYSGDICLLSANKLCFDYRTSALKQYGIALGAILRFSLSESNKLLSCRDECLGIRKKTQPLNLPSAGSVFKNPVCGAGDNAKCVSAGWLLEQVGLKGVEYEGVAYSTVHANWLVKTGKNATANAVRYLVELGQKTVKDEMDIWLEPEIELW